MTESVPVPETLEEALDPAWLSLALSQRHPGIEVANVIVRSVDTRISTNARFTVECTGGVPDGLSPHLCVKGYFGEAGRPFAFLGGPEACFYATLAEPMGVRTLRSHYAGASPETGAGVFVTEDIITAGGDFLDALSPYSVDQAAQSLSEFARLHAFGWGLPKSVHEPWLAPRIDMYFGHRGEGTIQSNFDGPVGVDVAPEARDAGRLVRAQRLLAARQEGPGWTLIHGDAHVGNIFLAGDGQPSLVDWQLVQRNFWGIDVGYHIASTISTEDRERAERDLLRHYLSELSARGVDAPSWEEAWTAYRIGTVYGFFMWGITIIVKPEIVRVLLQRLSAAVAAHDGFAAVGV
ncbi:phosphotransferase [Frankia sp. CNm7]|uniref:Phosphotransferase n=1 Tax=Frankia nepalensis TaxID=1836974 RepID=A0A937R9L5_9ACTN|nr:phosphotransferase [Frankia nepalensis]MBL7502330.1 phosphotransferase [Frankia nepalensis]MBL7516155.1 phosphotransferase [Frankia nepalensis]MBL7522047.1 phosphotransferase [Frankia nepalensis]MBL7625662.1 phosphotransferase [Frankia nepalensis]